MPTPQKQADPDFIPADTPDFIPVEGQPANEVAGAHVASAPKQETSIGPREGGVVPWLEDAEEDLRHGGSRTVVGRGLGFMQGRGNKGYEGLESGTSPEVADTMGSVPLGLTHAFKGVAEIPHHPLKGAWDTATGAAQAATIPLAFAGGPIADAAIESIPSRAHAGSVFSDLRSAAANVPVNLQKTQPELERFMELTQRGGRTSKPFTQLSKRAATGDPINFPEGRDFYSNISDAAHRTPLEKLMGRGMKPVMNRQANAVKSAFNEDLGQAADSIGRGADYTNAMKEYANAMKIRKYTRAAALLGAGEAARRTGLLGNWIHRAAITQP